MRRWVDDNASALSYLLPYLTLPHHNLSYTNPFYLLLPSLRLVCMIDCLFACFLACLFPCLYDCLFACFHAGWWSSAWRGGNNRHSRWWKGAHTPSHITSSQPHIWHDTLSYHSLSCHSLSPTHNIPSLPPHITPPPLPLLPLQTLVLDVLDVQSYALSPSLIVPSSLSLSLTPPLFLYSPCRHLY